TDKLHYDHITDTIPCNYSTSILNAKDKTIHSRTTICYEVHSTPKVRNQTAENRKPKTP
ncbi:hypothetical protein PISMIDRAFT_687314, partial [Pisolithus microcarpus 441]